MKLKYLRHPMRTAKTAKALFDARLSMWKFAAHGQRRFKGDARYDLENVTRGFASSIDETSDNTELLERICAAYSKAVNQSGSPRKHTRHWQWWQEVRQ